MEKYIRVPLQDEEIKAFVAGKTYTANLFIRQGMPRIRECMKL